MPKRVWAAPPWPARVPLPSDDDDTARVVAAAGGARGVTHALVSLGDERVIEATLTRLHAERAARTARLTKALDAGVAASDVALRAEWDALIARVTAPPDGADTPAPVAVPRDLHATTTTTTTTKPTPRPASIAAVDDATPRHRRARRSQTLTPATKAHGAGGDEVVAATPDAELAAAPSSFSAGANKIRATRSRSRSSAAPILADTPPIPDAEAADDGVNDGADDDDDALDHPGSYKPLASSQLAGRYSISATAEYRAAAAMAFAKTPTATLRSSLETTDDGVVLDGTLDGTLDGAGDGAGDDRIRSRDLAAAGASSLGLFDSFPLDTALPRRVPEDGDTLMVEETPRSEMDRRAGGSGSGNGSGNTNANGNGSGNGGGNGSGNGFGAVGRRRGVAGHRLRFSVGGSLVAEAGADAGADEETPPGLGAERIFSATHASGSVVLGVIAPPPIVPGSGRVFAVVTESSEGSEDVTVMVWRVRDDDGDDGDARGGGGNRSRDVTFHRSGTTCELAGSARLRKRDWTGAGGKENASPRKVNIASLMPGTSGTVGHAGPSRSARDSLDPAARGKPQSGAQLCGAVALSPCGEFLAVAESQFIVRADGDEAGTRRGGGGRGACVVRVESRRDERGTNSAWIDDRDVVLALDCPRRVTRLAMRWDAGGSAGDGSDGRSARVVVVAGAPLGKMHAWRFRASDLEPASSRRPGKRPFAKLPGERMPDLRYLDQTPMSDPLDALAFASTGDDVVAVTHDGLVVGNYRAGPTRWETRGTHYTQRHRIRAIAPLRPAAVAASSASSASASFVPFLALMERKAEPRDGVLRLHAGAVGGGVDVCSAMPLDGVCSLAAGPRTGALVAVGTRTGDVLAFDVVTGGTIARPGDLRGEDGGVVGVATAPWEAAAGGGARSEEMSLSSAMLVAASKTRVVAYMVRAS